MSSVLVFNLPCLVKFANEKIKGPGMFHEKCPCIGVLRDGKIAAVCVYDKYDGTGITMNIASDGSKRWMTKQFLRACFEYAFNGLKVRRVTGLVRKDQPDVVKFDEHLGFRVEGVVREGDDDGCDLVLLGMLRKECRWIKQ